jgi:BirA family biotin operon repressor/biotin-[acetyl-CoA-carboxylase] ligase
MHDEAAWSWKLPGPPAPARLAGWHVQDEGVVASTQELARSLPAWHAVAARAQTGGRGQRDRVFVSAPGGLYVTAVLPYAGGPLRTRGFALGIGWALRETLRRAGASGLRLRWPNDLMAGRRKVGGILVEQAGPDTLLVGIGLNITNQPGRDDPALAETAGRLRDIFRRGRLPSRDRLLELVLRAVRVAHAEFARRELSGFVGLLNRCWGRSRRVHLDLAGRPGDPAAAEGWFTGVEPDGGVRLEDGQGHARIVPPHRIDRLREID